jgi:hypothetical protein
MLRGVKERAREEVGRRQYGFVFVPSLRSLTRGSLSARP